VLAYCISHSYEHVADKINLNNARAEIRPQDVADRVKMVLRPCGLGHRYYNNADRY
jgi:hypothetical protein